MYLDVSFVFVYVSEEISEEADYVNAPACSVDKVAAPPGPL